MEEIKLDNLLKTKKEFTDREVRSLYTAMKAGGITIMPCFDLIPHMTLFVNRKVYEEIKKLKELEK